MLILVEGPAGSGKSQVLALMRETGEVDVVSDVTRLWAALGGYERGPDGRYPVRADDDPALITALYVQAVAARRALREGAAVAVTTSRAGQAARWQALAAEVELEVSFEVSYQVRTVDPGESVVRARLADPDTGELSADCSRAVQRWYRR